MLIISIRLEGISTQVLCFMKQHFCIVGKDHCHHCVSAKKIHFSHHVLSQHDSWLRNDFLKVNNKQKITLIAEVNGDIEKLWLITGHGILVISRLNSDGADSKTEFCMMD